MAAFDYRQALEIRDVFERRGVEYLFIGKSGAVLQTAANRQRDRESLPRLRSFREYWIQTRGAAPGR